ncbi:MAG: glycosyltransferase, partial [Thermoplasmatota archaeon]
LVDLGVDHITVSLWAGDAETYVKTHPNQKKETFERIKENLKLLYNLKKQSGLPKVKIYNVISKLNYNKIKEMIDFALETNAEFIEFQVIDTIPKKTDFLALSKKDATRVYKKINQLLMSKKSYVYNPNIDMRRNYYKGGKIESEEIEFPKRFIKLPKGFLLKVWKGKNNEEKFLRYVLKCPENHKTYPQSENNPVICEDKNQIIFKFKDELCRECNLKSKCPVDEDGSLRLNYLSVLGFGSFYRRLSRIISNNKNNRYDSKIVDSMPCYIGWTFSRILADGNLIPCCKAHRFPLGNLYEKRFKELWFSDKYNQFRIKAKTSKKSEPYFKEINCYERCDNLGMNLITKKKLEETRMITLYIPTKNSNTYLIKNLDGINALKLKEFINEILIVDGSEKCYYDQLKKIRDLVRKTIKKDLRIIRQKNPGLAKARNIAVKNSHSNLIAALDADCVPSKNWLAQLMKTMEEENADGVCGRVVELQEQKKSLSDSWRAAHLKQDFGNKKLINPPYLIGANTLFKKEVLENVGFMMKDTNQTMRMWIFLKD